MTRYELNKLYHEIVDIAIIVHKRLGPGLLESIYSKVLAYELNRHGYKAVTEVPMNCIYEGINMGLAFRADIIVEDEIIIEVKSTKENQPVYFLQLISYLRVANKRLGILFNFSYPILMEGSKRMVNQF